MIELPRGVLTAAAVLAGLGMVGLAWFVASRGGLAGAGKALGGAAVDAVAGAAEGVVVGIGEEIGIPRTNLTECEQAIAEGRTWDASFACPAGKFLGSLFN